MIRVRLVLFLFLAWPLVPSLADDAIHAEIDRAIWIPFKQAFESLDGEALNQLYAEEVLRITPGGVDTTGQFKLTNLTRFDENRQRGDKIDLNFWLDQRQSIETTSYNVGFYRIRFTSANGESQVYFGQFHIVLRKLEGRWKIVQDWDTGTIAGKSIDAELFESGYPPVPQK